MPDCRERILVGPHRIDGFLSSGGNAVVVAIAFVRTIGDVVCPFQLRKSNILGWNVLNGRVRRFAERQGVAAVGDHPSRNGYDNGSRIALDGKSDVLDLEA